MNKVQQYFRHATKDLVGKIWLGDNFANCTHEICNQSPDSSFLELTTIATVYMSTQKPSRQ